MPAAHSEKRSSSSCSRAATDFALDKLPRPEAPYRSTVCGVQLLHRGRRRRACPERRDDLGAGEREVGPVDPRDVSERDPLVGIARADLVPREVLDGRCGLARDHNGQPPLATKFFKFSNGSCRGWLRARSSLASIDDLRQVASAALTRWTDVTRSCCSALGRGRPRRQSARRSGRSNGELPNVR